MKQRWDRQAIYRKIGKARTVILVSSCLIITAAIVLSLPDFIWFGTAGLLLWLGLTAAARIQSDSDSTGSPIVSQPEDTGTSATVLATPRSTLEMVRPSEQEQPEDNQVLHHVPLDQPQKTSHWQKRTVGLPDVTAQPVERPAPTSPDAARPDVLPVKQVDVQAMLPGEIEALIKTLRAKIGDNYLEMALMEHNSVEHRRREREVARDGKLLAEAEHRRLQPAPKAAQDAFSVTPSGILLSVGDIIIHKQFQRGVVIAVDKTGIATIDFDQFGRKKFATCAPFDRNFTIVGRQPPTHRIMMPASAVTAASEQATQWELG